MRVAVTGHRPNKIGGYSEENFLRLTAFAKKVFTEISPAGIITGMAQGWDMAAAQAAIELQLPWVAAIPCDGQERPWPMAAQTHYRELLTQATKVVYVSQASYASHLMMARNRWMIDRCHLLVALWDGTPGGTGNAVRYAQSINRPIKQVWDSLKHFQ